MRLILIVILIGGLFWWLSGQGIVSFDNAKAKTYVNNALDKIDPKGAKSGRTLRDVPNVDYEVSKLCTELKDISERAMKLRNKLLDNVVDSTNPEKVASRTKSSRYSRR